MPPAALASASAINCNPFFEFSSNKLFKAFASSVL
jgi:hypothetical protein